MYKVLLVDDEKWVLEDLEAVIDWKSIGYDIIAIAEDTIIAERLIKKLKPDLVLCDIKMPGEDGITFFRRLRQQHLNIQVIYLTAYDEFRYAKEAIHLGALGYLLKPVEENMLIDELQRVKKVLDEHQRNRIARELLVSIDEKEQEEKEEVNGIVKSIIKDIRGNYQEKLQLAVYAERYFINASYLSQQFKQVTGKAFRLYVLDLRLAKAEELLIDTELTINEISDKVGYSDYVHFSKLFKKHRGESPQQYRNRYRE